MKCNRYVAVGGVDKPNRFRRNKCTHRIECDSNGYTFIKTFFLKDFGRFSSLCILSCPFRLHRFTNSCNWSQTIRLYHSKNHWRYVFRVYFSSSVSLPFQFAVEMYSTSNNFIKSLSYAPMFNLYNMLILFSFSFVQLLRIAFD